MPNQRALFAEALGVFQVRTVDLCVVGQLTRLPKARVEFLPDLADVRLVAIVARPPIVHDVPKGGGTPKLPLKDRR